MPHIPFLKKNEIIPLEVPDGRMLDPTLRADWRRMGRDFGFFVCQIPGLQKLRSELYSATRQFLSLPHMQKREISFESIDQGPFGNVGYFSFGSETAVSGNAPDPKEFFHIGPSARSLEAFPRDYPITPFPHSMPELAGIFGSAHDELSVIANKLLHTLCQVYDVDEPRCFDKGWK